MISKELCLEFKNLKKCPFCNDVEAYVPKFASNGKRYCIDCKKCKFLYEILYNGDDFYNFDFKFGDYVIHRTIDLRSEYFCCC